MSHDSTIFVLPAKLVLLLMLLLRTWETRAAAKDVMGKSGGVGKGKGRERANGERGIRLVCAMAATA